MIPENSFSAKDTTSLKKLPVQDPEVVQELLVVTNDGSNKSEEDPEFVAFGQRGYAHKGDAIYEFFQQYMGQEGSLAKFLKDTNSFGPVLESIREGYDPMEWSKRQDEVQEFLTREVVNSLDILSEEIKQNNLDNYQAKRRFHNIFLVISEALQTENIVQKRKLETWLGEHVQSAERLSPSISDKVGVTDVAGLAALKDIVIYTEDPILAQKYFEVADVVMSKGNVTLIDSDFYKVIMDRLRSLRSYTPEVDSFVTKRLLITQFISEKIGIDQKIIEKWKEAKIVAGWSHDRNKNIIYGDSYSENIDATLNLEKKKKGSANELFKKFGIANFARYSTDMLIHQLEKEDVDVPYGVIVFPEADYNGAFFQDATMLYEAGLKLRMGGLETRIIEAGSQRELARRLVTMDKKYALKGNKISFAIFGGHGTERSLSLGESKGGGHGSPPLPSDKQTDEEYQTELEAWVKLSEFKDKGYFSSDHISEGKGIQRAVKEFFYEAAPVVLISCSTGAAGGIAEIASSKSGGDVSAPLVPTNIKKIDVTFGEKGKPIFHVTYNEPQSARYVAGKKVDS